ncbi:MAG: hypothetical protein ACE5F7_04890 [Nitrospiria bacterium]
MPRYAFIYEGLCLLAIAFFSWRLYTIWPLSEAAPEGISIETAVQVKERQGLETLQSEKPSRVSFETIARKNLFNPSRVELWEKPRKPQARPAPAKNLKPPISAPAKPNTLILEGIMIYGDKRSALVKDRFKPQEGARRVRVGDELNGYKITAMTDREVALTDVNGTKRVLTLFQSKAAVERRHTKTRVHTQPAASGPQGD